MQTKKIQNISSIDLNKYNTVFCDSLQALEWAYQNGLSKNAIIKASSPAVLWSKKKNIHNVEARWTVSELNEFRNTIQNMTESIFDAALGVHGVDRELAISTARSVYRFQTLLYKSACLEEEDFTDHRLFIYVDGKNGPAGNIMNSPWDKLISNNELFSILSYTLKNDKWSILTTQGISYWRRFRVAGYETIIYRLAVKLMKNLPDWLFKKKVLMPNENELNIEVASSLAMRGVKISDIKSNFVYDKNKSILDKNTVTLIYKEILPIVCERIKRWTTPSAVDITIELFKSHLENELNQFDRFVIGWGEVVKNSNNIKQIVLANAPGNLQGQALSYVCRKNKIPLVSSQHGVTIEFSKAHSMYHVGFDNSSADVMLSYNSKIVDIEKNIYFDKSEHYVVGMPMRLIRMKRAKAINKLSAPIVYIATNLYHMGFCISSKTDYGRAKEEQGRIINVLSQLPHKVRYKTYPEDNRRYADIDPVLNDVENSDNMELFNKKIDMRYLVSEHRILVTTSATSTLGWPIMSGKPVVFINQKNKSPLTDDAHAIMSKGMFVFDDDEEDFFNKLKVFLSQPVGEIERLWKSKKSAHSEMVNMYFSAYKGGAGNRSAKIILKKYL
ncbi:hypothetical protein HOL24_04440 [bacterium]|jgi:hypothetical protein|nr:hypothetical protein [bacterium]